MANKQKKRGRGRPRREPMSGEELRMKAEEGIRRAKERRLGREDIDVPEFVEEVSAVTGKHKFTRQEMDEIRERVDLLYTEFITQKHDAEAEKMEQYVPTLRALALDSDDSIKRKMQTPAEWAENHCTRLNGKQKPGPKPKKKKTIFEVEPGQWGTSDKPGEPIDLDALEEQWLVEQMEAEQSKPKQRKGKRLSRDIPTPVRRSQQKSFWI